jgi:predicted Zn-dependent protease
MRRLIFFLVLTTPLHAVDQTAKLSEFAMGLYAERDGDTDSARQHFEATLEADPDAFFLARKTSATQLALEDLGAASGTLRHYAKSHPDHLSSHIYYADFLNQWTPRDAAARQTAIATLEGANERFPHNNAVFSRLINLYENNEEPEKSRALLDAQFDAPDAGPSTVTRWGASKSAGSVGYVGW